MPSIGRKKGTVHGVLTVIPGTAVPAYYAFFDVGDGTIQVSVYDSRGAWVEDVGDPISAPTLLFSTNPTARLCFIAADTFGAVGDGSLAYWNDDGTITVIDTLADSSATYSALTATYVGLGLGYVGGWLYFVEAAPFVAGSTVVRLRKMRTDGSGLTTANSITITPSGRPLGHWQNMRGFRLTADNAMASGRVVDLDGGDGEDFLFPLDGSTATNGERTDDSSETFWGIPGPSGSFGIFSGPDRAANTIHAMWANAWPATAWAPASVDLNATEAMAYSPTDGIARSLLAGFGSTPTTIILGASIANHPTLMAQPNAMFLLP